MDRGQAAAFTGALDRPPSSSWEIMNPREYEKGHVPSIPYLPDIHPLVDKTYRPYDIGQVGQLDVHILSGLFGGDRAARDLTPAWDGGIYWAGQRLNADSGRTGQHQVHLALLLCLSGKTRRPPSLSAICMQTNWAANTLASNQTRLLPQSLTIPMGPWNRSTAPTKGRSSLPDGVRWCLFQKASTFRWPAILPASSLERRAAARSSPHLQAGFRPFLPRNICLRPLFRTRP